MKSTIIGSLREDIIRRSAQRCRERRIKIPTFAELRDPRRIPASVASRLEGVGLSDVNPVNLFRITWKNDLGTGFYGGVNALEIPPAITGVDARIIGLVGKHFPTGAHKVGAAFGCLAPRLVAGEFDPTTQKAVWPSTGNYCRGGAFDSALLGCQAIAILPEGMSRERFDWLRSIGAEIIATPGCESNVKEIFDACWEIRKTRADAVIFNQFEEFGNYLWHFGVTGPAAEETFAALAGRRARLAAWVGATGSAGTLAAGDYLKQRFPGSTITVAEALQCPTLLRCGFGAHRIEGIGDKHVPWIHNPRNTDLVAAIDDEAPMRLLRVFNEPAGHELLVRRGVPPALVAELPLLGISSIANLLAAIKTARYFDLGERDVIFTVFTDSSELYRSRLADLRRERGAYRARDAVADFAGPVAHQGVDHFKELGYADRKALHHLKYYTWVEQQGKTSQELTAQWDPDYWRARFEGEVKRIDRLIEAFNAAGGAGA